MGPRRRRGTDHRPTHGRICRPVLLHHRRISAGRFVTARLTPETGRNHTLRGRGHQRPGTPRGATVDPLRFFRRIGWGRRGRGRRLRCGVRRKRHAGLTRLPIPSAGGLPLQVVRGVGERNEG